MALTKEDLHAIYETLEKKRDAQPETLEHRLDVLDCKMDLFNEKLDDLAIEIKMSERSIRKDLQSLLESQLALIAALEKRAVPSSAEKPE